MNRIASYLGYIAAGVLAGIWLMVQFSVLLMSALTPFLGGAGEAVTLLVLLVGPALLAAVLKRRFS